MLLQCPHASIPTPPQATAHTNGPPDPPSPALRARQPSAHGAARPGAQACGRRSAQPPPIQGLPRSPHHPHRPHSQRRRSHGAHPGPPTQACLLTPGTRGVNRGCLSCQLPQPPRPLPSPPEGPFEGCAAMPAPPASRQPTRSSVCHPECAHHVLKRVRRAGR
eukprot:330221-Chlamydomonas_euryale.AAC.3